MEPRQKASSYEEISSVHIIYNRYVQNAIKRCFKSTAGKKDGRNQDEVELFQDRIAVSARESVTPFKLHKARHTGNSLLKNQTNLDTKEMNLLHQAHFARKPIYII